MADEVIMINGPPGVGKTKVGAEMAGKMSTLFLSKDVLKDHLARERIGMPSSRLGVLASELMWSEAAAQRGVVIVESWWYRTRDVRLLPMGCSGLALIAQSKCGARPRRRRPRAL